MENYKDQQDRPLYSLTIREYVELNRQLISEIQDNVVPPINEQTEEILDIKKAALLINLSVPSVYTLTSKRQIPFMKKQGGKKLYFRRSELLRWLDEGRRKTKKEIDIEADKYVSRNRRPL
jgi:predicted DNA-binding transcriptional regulator AlpA